VALRTLFCSESDLKTAEICNRWIYIAVANSSGKVDVSRRDEHVAILNSPRAQAGNDSSNDLFTLSFIRSLSVTTSNSIGKMYTEIDRKEVRKKRNI
jgi:hypothetical protein